jgi:hypothetical protein
MSSLEQQPPGSNVPGGGGAVPLITREIFEAYVNCKYKGYLKLIGQAGTPSDHKVLMEEVRQELRQRASESLGRRYRDEILKAPVVTPSLLRTGPPLILDAVVENGGFSLVFDALKRVDASGRQSAPQYVPILVFEGEKVRKEHRQILEVYALALARVQGVEPKSGMILHGRGCRSTSVHFIMPPPGLCRLGFVGWRQSRRTAYCLRCVMRHNQRQRQVASREMGTKSRFLIRWRLGEMTRPCRGILRHRGNAAG